MVEVLNMINRLKEFEKEVPDVLMDLLKDRKGLIVKMNVKEMFGGKDGEGDDIKPPYRPSTIKRKRRRGQPYDRVTLRDKGDFHNSVDVKYGKRFFELVSDDKKVKYLMRKYGEDILGLSSENVERLVNDLKEDFREIFQRKLIG